MGIKVIKIKIIITKYKGCLNNPILIPNISETVRPEKNLYKLNISTPPLKSLITAKEERLNNKQSEIPQNPAKIKQYQY